MADVKWIKIATEIFDNQKIRMIEAMPEGDSIIVIWFKLLMLAGKVNDGGLVYFTREIPYTEQMLSTYFNRPLTTIQLALNTFERFGMMEIVDELIYISGWEEYQNVDGLEKIREQTRKRVAKHRELKKLEKLSEECNATCNATLTQSNATDKELEIEQEREIKTKGSVEPREVKSPKRYSEDDELDSAIKDFIKHRKALRKPMTDRAIELFINKLKKISTDKSKQIAMIEEAIERGWQTVYPPKTEQAGSSPSWKQATAPTDESKQALKAIENMYFSKIK